MRQVTRKGLMTVAAATGVLAATGGYAHADSTAQGTAAGSPGALSGNSIQVPVHVPVNVCGNTADIAGLLNPASGNRCANTDDRHRHARTGGQHAGGGQGRAAEAQVRGARVQAPAQAQAQDRTRGGDVRGGHSAPGHTGAGAAGESGRHGQQGHEHQGSWQPGHGKHAAYSASAHSGGAHSGGGAEAAAVANGSPGILSGNSVQVPLDIPVNVCGNSVDILGIANPAVGNGCVNTGGDHHHTLPHHHRPTPHPAVPGHPARPHTPPVTATPGTPPNPGHGVQQAVPPRLAETGSGLPMGTVVPLAAGSLLAGGILYRRSRLSA
jgi:ChpA-C